ncbi:MAG: polysaccharide deacetylase family protein [Bryobacterales bacterium]|nr:polysaccharide deacetylase family protein [Bryobacterales bacterium]
MHRLLFGFFCFLPLAAADGSPVRFLGKTKYLNNAHAVVTHTIDDSTKSVIQCLDTMDKYGIKATIFVSTEEDPAPEDVFFTQLQMRELWPRLRQAINNGHEIGSHSRQHPCRKPDSESFCSAAYTDYEITGSRDDILRMTNQPHVWSWCYPCGNCANYEFIQKRIAAAGYIVARNYPNEATNGHMRPNVRTWDSNTMNAGYTQAVQHKGTAKNDTVDSAGNDATFDEVYRDGGIYNFMSHPQWLDYGPNEFYERHLARISGRKDVWYVPMGPLYAFRTLTGHTTVRALDSGRAKARFAVSNDLDGKIYNGSITLAFAAPPDIEVLSGGRKLPSREDRLTDRWNAEYVRREGERLYVTVRPATTLEFVSTGSVPPGPDVTGNWKATYTTRSGRKRESTFALKMENGRLTGTITSERGRAPITEGGIAGHELAFTVVRKGNGDEVAVEYQGRVEGDVMNLRMRFGGHEALDVTARRAP